MMIKNNHQSNLFEVKKIKMKNLIFASKPWKQKELLTEEFKSLGFYLSDHPLNEYEEYLINLKIIPYNQFYEMQ